MPQGKSTTEQSTEFFSLVASRNFTAAERVLEGLRSKLKRTEWSHGYLMALRGMLSATKTNDDRYAFIKRLNLESKARAGRMRREFIRISKENLQTDFDRGFFSAWARFAKALGENETLRANCLKSGVGNRVKEGPEEEPE